MTARRIRGLRWAAKATRPGHTPGRASGAKAAGLRYERALAKALPTGWSHGEWFEFEDLNGWGMCQPDFFKVGSAVVVLEAKYTWTSEASCQLMHLYRPVLEAVFGRPVYGVQVCKRLVPGATGLVRCLASAIEAALAGGTPALQWLERTPFPLWVDRQGLGRRGIDNGACA